MRLSIENLSKTYPNGTKALRGITLTIYNGMFGLLGPNGAGKSSLMRTIATLQSADSGRILLDDIDVLNEKDKVRKVLGYLPQEFGLYPRIDAETLLSHIALLKGITHARQRKDITEALLVKTNLWSARKKNLATFSGGMKQRFGIAQALIGDPALLIVDEPTAGLDPGERNRFLNLLSELGENTIVILSTHIVEDVKELCPNMAVISEGQVLFEGRPANAIRDLQGRIWKKHVEKGQLPGYRTSFTVVSERLFAGTPEIHVLSEQRPDSSFEEVNVGLEDVYFTMISRSAVSQSSPR